jgi:biopolymer transport protein ExbD
MITLHELRWAYVAVRGAIFLMLLVLMSMTIPAVDAFVSTPSLRGGRPYAVRNDDVVITVHPDGTTFVAYTWTPAKDLGRELEWMREHNPRSRLVLRGDRGASFGAVRNVFRAASDAGWQRITIEGQPPMLLLERRIRAGLALPEPDDSKLVRRDTGISLDGMWHQAVAGSSTLPPPTFVTVAARGAPVALRWPPGTSPRRGRPAPERAEESPRARGSRRRPES